MNERKRQVMNKLASMQDRLQEACGEEVSEIRDEVMDLSLQLLRTAAKEIAEAREQRDALLAACEFVIQGSSETDMAVLWAAIKIAKGESDEKLRQ